MKFALPTIVLTAALSGTAMAADQPNELLTPPAVPFCTATTPAGHTCVMPLTAFKRSVPSFQDPSVKLDVLVLTGPPPRGYEFRAFGINYQFSYPGFACGNPAGQVGFYTFINNDCPYPVPMP